MGKDAEKDKVTLNDSQECAMLSNAHGARPIRNPIFADFEHISTESEKVFSLTEISESAYIDEVAIRFSRHARNKMRLYNLTPEEVEEVITSGEKLIRGDKWESQSGKLRVIWLMVGSYALVVTVVRTR